MQPRITRRTLLAAAAAAALPGATRPNGVLIDTHIHLFADDQSRFPYHAQAVYKPPPQPLAPYTKFIAESKIAHTIIVHPEPYQDDHRYLEYCFANEPSKGFFKGTCLYDPIDPKTPARMAELIRRNPNRIVALRVHANRAFDKPPTTSGAIRERDFRHPQMRATWAAAHKLGLAIQAHFIPCWGPQIGELAARFPDMPVILDHLARAGQGTPQEYGEVLKLAKLPRVYMKFSGWRYSSRQEHPFRDAKPLVRRTYDAFGPDRMIWGGLGHDMTAFAKAIEVFETQFDFLAEADKAKIRGQNAAQLLFR